jgi:hypothetical protein
VTRLLIVVVVVLVAAVVAHLIGRRRPDAPVRTGWSVPDQLDRADFARPEAPWLVVLFSAATCSTCAGVRGKVGALESDQVAVHDVEYGAERLLHDRYRIEAVPTVLVADAAGTVRRSFLGPVSATHLWAAVAEVREPGSTPPGCGGQPPQDSA